jgi:16S rRNA (cytidine1402-2'-O)-methyltransferase
MNMLLGVSMRYIHELDPLAARSPVLKDQGTLSTRTGILWIIATPIGNLEDLSPRAARLLGEVDAVLAEDTRHARILLTHVGVAPQVLSLHEHNEAERVTVVLERLALGQDLALISDAGTPLVSDPGYRLVRAARLQGYRVLPVPGPSAVLAALSVAGLPTDRFVFAGFLPATQAARQERLTHWLQSPMTVVCFESTHRILACADDLAQLAPEREVALSRELTKRFEEHYLGQAQALPEWLQADPQRVRGEWVLVLAPAPDEVSDATCADRLTSDQEQTLRVLLDALPLKQAVQLTCRITGAPRNPVYARAMQLKDAAAP